LNREPPSDPVDRDDRIHAQIVQRLYRQAPGGMIATLVNAGILTLVLRGEAPSVRLVIWLGAMVLLSGVRGIQIATYHRASPPPDKSRAWGRAFLMGLFCSGVLWGCSAVFLFPAHSPAHQALLTIVLCGMTAGALGSFSSLPKAFALFTLPALTPLFIRFLMIPDPIHRALAAMTLLFFALTMSTVRRTSRADRERLELKEHFAELLEERTAELKRSNDRLKDEIEERKRAENALAESEERYRSLFDHIPDLLYMHDLEGKLMEANRAWEVYGFDRNELKGLYVGSILAERYRDGFKDYLLRLEENGWDEGFMRIQGKDGAEHVVEYRNEVIWDKNGFPSAVRGCGRDVTDRILARKEKETLQAQLMQAQRLEAIGTLAGGIAHNVNNILMGIQGNVSLGSMEIDADHPLAGRLKTISRLVDRGADLAGKILAYAREGKVHVKALDLNGIVHGTASTFGETRKDISVRLDLATDLWAVEADSGQIRQAVMSLCVNGAEAMPGGGELLVRTRNLPREEAGERIPGSCEKDYVELEVADTGVGMDRKTLSRVFDPFFTTKAVGRGTGLSLASVQGMVESHGGHIHVESEVGRGSSFQVYLPALRDFTGEEPMLMEERRKTGNMKILLVDDEEIILEVGVQMLEALGYGVLKAQGGHEALQVYGEHGSEIDLVILDMIMPDLSGGATFDRLKEMDPNVRVLLSSGYSIDGEASEILDRGCSGFIQKPFRLSDLSDALTEMMGGAKTS